MTIGVSIGDPNGIGPEVVLKAFADFELLKVCTPIIYAHFDFMRQQAKYFDLELPMERMIDHPKQGVLNVVDCWAETFQPKYGEVDAKAGELSSISFVAATEANTQISYPK